MDTEGKNVKTADFFLNIDKNNLTFMWIDTSAGAFTSYTNPIERIAAAGQQAGKPVFWFGAMISPSTINWTVEVAKLTLKPQAWVENALVWFYNIPDYAGDDSNVAQTINGITTDSITQATNWLYGFIDGDCPAEKSTLQAQKPSDRAAFQNAAPVLAALDEAALWTRRYMQRYIRLIILVVITGGIYMVSKQRTEKVKKLVK